MLNPVAEPILLASDLKKVYWQGQRPIEAVRDVSLRVGAGEVLAFLGPNGAGKTTSIKMIAGLIYPDAGSVRIAERDPYRDPMALVEVGAVLEGNRNLYWRLTPRQNLIYFGALRGLSRRLARQRGDDLLEQFGLSEKRDMAVQTLSRGMQQKVALAVAMVHNPKLLLLDEPTLGLDVEATQVVKGLIKQIAGSGRGILLTTHQLDIAEALSDRVAIIQQGQIVAEAPTRELIRQFSGSAYSIELEQDLDPWQKEQIQALGGVMARSHQIKFVGESEQLYQLLGILKPVPLHKVVKDEADLTQVFLKVLRSERLSGEDKVG